MKEWDGESWESYMYVGTLSYFLFPYDSHQQLPQVYN